MSTKALIVFSTIWGKELAVVYKKFDGHIEKLGKYLIDILKDKRMVNEINSNIENDNEFDGSIFDLSTYVISKLKTKPGDVFLYTPGTRNLGEEYIYYIPAVINDRATFICHDLINEKVYTMLQVSKILYRPKKQSSYPKDEE